MARYYAVLRLSSSHTLLLLLRAGQRARGARADTMSVRRLLHAACPRATLNRTAIIDEHNQTINGHAYGHDACASRLRASRVPRRCAP